MSFASNLQITALRLLTTYGQNVIFTRVVEGDYNPTTSQTSDITTITFTGKGHPEPYTSSEISASVSAGRDGSLILHTDINLLTYTATLPIVGDIATLDSIEYRVMNVSHTKVQGTDIIYNLQLRI